MLKPWLQRNADAEEVARYSRDPADYLEAEAANLAEELRRGGELWRFCSPPETWAALMGWAGYAVVRDGEIAASVVTEQN